MLWTNSLYRWLLNLQADGATCGTLNKPLHRALLIWLQLLKRGSQAKGDMVKSLSPFSSLPQVGVEHPPWCTLPHPLHSSEMLLAERFQLLSCKYLLFPVRKPHCYMTWSCSNAVTVAGCFLCFSHSKLGIGKREFSGHPYQQVMTYSKKKGLHSRPYGRNKGRARAGLAQNSATLRFVAEHSRVGLWTVDLNNRLARDPCIF